MFALLLAPFVVLIAASLWKALTATHHAAGITPMGAPPVGYDLAGAISVTLWNYMGWDNASTVAQEVQQPQRNYPRAMLIAAALIAVTYTLPLAAVSLAGIPAGQFSTGAWTDAARTIVGPGLALAVVLGGLLNGAGMFNALMLSYTRVPYALAKDGLLPHCLTRTTRAGVPWVSVVLCAFAWALALNLSFDRLISIDLVLYGAALLLEFVALVVLRLREPSLHRPFKVPGGIAGAVASGIGPAILILFALWAARAERVGPFPALGFAAAVAVAGPPLYLIARAGKRNTA
jgi:amino acid transporter